MRPSRGSIVVMDLDGFGELVEQRGFSRYLPNIVTGTLSTLVESFARRFQAVIIYGLNWDRGTEEAVLEIPGVEAGELVDELVRIAEEIWKLGASITIVAITGYVTGVPARDRREAYKGFIRSKARRILGSLKRRCGGTVYVDGANVWEKARVSLGALRLQACTHSF